MATSPTTVFEINLKRRLDDDRLTTKKQCVEGSKAMKGPFYYLNNGTKPDEKRADKNCVLDDDRIWVQDKPRLSGKGIGKIYWVGNVHQAYYFLSHLPLDHRSFYEWISQKDYVRPFFDFDLVDDRTLSEMHLKTLKEKIIEAFTIAGGPKISDKDLHVSDSSKAKSSDTYKISFHVTLFHDQYIFPWCKYKKFDNFMKTHLKIEGVDLAIYSSGRQFRTVFASKQRDDGSYSIPLYPLVNGLLQKEIDKALWLSHLIVAHATESSPFSNLLDSKYQIRSPPPVPLSIRPDRIRLPPPSNNNSNENKQLIPLDSKIGKTLVYELKRMFEKKPDIFQIYYYVESKTYLCINQDTFCHCCGGLHDGTTYSESAPRVLSKNKSHFDINSNGIRF